MGDNNFSFARYFAELLVGFSRNLFDENGRCRPVGWLLVIGVALGWAACPFAIATVCHPADLLRWQAYFQGADPWRAFTAGQLASGFVQAVVAVVVLLVFQLVGTVLFYRRARLYNAGAVAAPVLWPLAALLTGIVGNAAWFIGTGGHFDVVGCLIGFSSVVLTEVCEWGCEGLGREFVFPAALTGQHS
jgi:hypothetical protein